jgi:hypothetical protein
MIHDVVRAVYKGGYTIELEFDDGERGLVDFSKYLHKGGVFERLNDLEFFRTFTVSEDLGTLTWGNEIDVAPETLYAEATGRGLPSWMDPDEEHSANEPQHSDPSQAPG